jgi:predicted metalloendopeptidase
MSIGMIQKPFFSTEYPDPVNYGSMGSFLAHEITHAFHQTPSFQPAPRPEQFLEAFGNRTRCLVSQFNEFPLPENKHVQGGFTLLENMSDLMGVHVAFKAFQEKLQGIQDENERRSQNQLFFLSWAQSWCSNITPEFLEHLRFADRHAPPKYRVIGPLSNLDSFSHAFQCPKGTTMNRESKCTFWA